MQVVWQGECHTLHFPQAAQAATGHQSRGPSWETGMNAAARDSWPRGTQIDLVHRHSKGTQGTDGATDLHQAVNQESFMSRRDAYEYAT